MSLEEFLLDSFLCRWELSVNVNVVSHLQDLPVIPQEGDAYFVEESKDYFSEIVYYVGKMELGTFTMLNSL